MLEGHFARVSTHEGTFSSLLSLPRDLAPKYLTGLITWSILQGGNSAPRDEIIPMKSLVHTEGLCSSSVPLWHNPGAKPSVCIGLCTSKGMSQGHVPQTNAAATGPIVCVHTFIIVQHQFWEKFYPRDMSHGLHSLLKFWGRVTGTQHCTNAVTLRVNGCAPCTAK